MADIEKVLRYLQETLSPNLDARRTGETVLKNLSVEAGFSLLLLQIQLNQAVPLSIRLSAIVFFKNFIRENWANEVGIKISPTDRQQIKDVIVTLMLEVPPQIQKQLAAALTIISTHDFPDQWPGLLPSLVARFDYRTGNWRQVYGILHTLHSVLRRYRREFKTPNVIQELKYILEIMQSPFLELFNGVIATIEQGAGGDIETMKVLFQIVHLLLKIFYSLNFIDLPAFFEENMNAFMEHFRKIIIYEPPSGSPLAIALLEGSTEEKPGLLHRAQARVCENLNLYLERYEEEFEQFLEVFVRDIWNMLLKTGNQQRYDALVNHSLRFLGAVSQSSKSSLFNSPETLQLICRNIVIPSMKLRDEDIEIFEDNPKDYIKMDMEGSNVGTRRHGALELVKGLRKNFEAEVSQIFSADITTLLQEYALNQGKWSSKDTAIYLVTALTVRGSTAAKGVLSTNAFVPILEFFSSQILPELTKVTTHTQTETPINDAILKADALKFVTTFRSQLSKETCVNLFTYLVNSLVDSNVVVHSYAALCLDKMFMLRDDKNQLRFSKEDIRPVLPSLLQNLFRALQFGQKDNEYIMSAVKRTLALSKEDLTPAARDCVAQLVSILGEVYKNPVNPGFNHNLFESIAALINGVGRSNPNIVPELENALFTPFQAILQMDIQEFSPYVFQLMSLLLELTPSVSQPYQALLPALVTPVLWERHGNIPALVRLIQAYLQKGGFAVVGSQLVPILAIFQQLAALNSTDHEGFYLLESIVLSLESKDFSAYLPQIFTIIFTRLTENKTAKFVKSFIIFLGVFIIKHGGSFVVQSIEKVQGRLTGMVIENLWLPNVSKIVGNIERKIVSVAMIKMLTDTPEFMQDPYSVFWGRILSALMSTLEFQSETPTVIVPHQQQETEDEGVINGDNSVEYSSAFNRLSCAPKPEYDPIPGKTDPKFILASQLAHLAQKTPALKGIVQSSISQDLLTKLNSYYGASPSPFA